MEQNIGSGVCCCSTLQSAPSPVSGETLSVASSLLLQSSICEGCGNLLLQLQTGTGRDVTVELARLQSRMVIPCLVIPVHSTHVAIVQGHRCTTIPFVATVPSPAAVAVHLLRAESQPCCPANAEPPHHPSGQSVSHPCKQTTCNKHGTPL